MTDTVVCNLLMKDLLMEDLLVKPSHLELNILAAPFAHKAVIFETHIQEGHNLEVHIQVVQAIVIKLHNQEKSSEVASSLNNLVESFPAC